ncbi:HIG1 domain-containing protein [Falsiroseomonas stagni]|uniref:Hypoxia induced protein conserved region n=1 Tax=Falsiroseomonas stagni DSM 19981 TaxID=1123062 RepID=A0A1I4DRN9_9PROT|nr:HIG1 domain-containing protein [Falsiroseomonas stagni]SFK96214.1 Hypoxia induced protein conserved region [Falsiroseomonas stagni DSM 19981]
MVTFLMVLVVLSMLGTLGVMFAGMLGLVRSDEGGGARSNKLMRARVVMQGVTLVLFLLLVLVKA